MRLRTVILDMQSGLYAGTMRRALVQELTEYQVIISPKPEETAAECRIVLIVDEIADKLLAEEVKKAKQSGLVDAFLYASASERYLAAVIDSL